MNIFLRDYRLTVATFDFSGLDIEFKVKKSLKPEPNTCEIKVYNVSEAHRKGIEATGGKVTPVPVRLEAGYKSASRVLLFLGEVRSGETAIEGADIITTLSTGDKEAIAKARISVPSGPGEPVATTLQRVVAALGVGVGNLATAQRVMANKGIVTFFPKGGVISGNAAQRLTDLCNSANMEWSIQDGNVQIVDRGKPLEGKAVLLSPSTGLVGSPTVDDKGIAQAKTFIIPDLRCGGKVVFDAAWLKGGYRIKEIEYTGNTREKEWYANLHCETY